MYFFIQIPLIALRTKYEDAHYSKGNQLRTDANFQVVKRNKDRHWRQMRQRKFSDLRFTLRLSVFTQSIERGDIKKITRHKTAVYTKQK